jgi:hypothetical protein
MKQNFLVLVTLFVLMFTSCEKENCRDHVLGTYTGSSTNAGTIGITVTVNTGNTLAYPSLGVSLSILSGELNADCTMITIPNQTQSNPSGDIISGLFSINDTNLTGTIYSNGNPTIIDCSK